MYLITLERLRRVPVRRSDEVWEVAMVELPARNREGAPMPIVCVCVSSAGVATVTDPTAASGGPLNAPLEAVANLALEPRNGDPPLNYLPSRVRVPPMRRDAMSSFSNAMRSLGVGVEVKRDLEHVDDVVGEMLEFIEGELAPPKVPPLLKSKVMTVERVRSFAEAAADFWRAAPWKTLDAEVAWTIDPAPKHRFLRACLVIGGAGEEFGIAFLPDAVELTAVKLRAALGPGPARPRGTNWGVTFDDADDVPQADLDLWAREGLPLAAPEAYPMPFGVTQAGKIMRPSPEQLTLMEAMLRVFAAATPEEMRGEAIEKTVGVFGGEVRYRLVSGGRTLVR